MSADWLYAHLSTLAANLLPALLEAAIKGAVILLLAAIVALAMRRASAAARHWIWFLGLAASLIVPILTPTLPAWHLLPRWPQIAMQPPFANPLPAQVASPSHAAPASIASSPMRAEVTAQPPSPLSMNTLPAHAPSSAAIAPAPVPSLAPLIWQAWILIAWLAGTILCLARMALGTLSLRRLEHQSPPITDDHWSELLRQACAQLRFHRPVTLLAHPRRAMPMTWGLRQTRILLPDESATWPPDQCRAVLLHELAHAKRRDCLTQCVAQLACALHWFNPLAWAAWKRLQSEREQACDDLVLTAGAKASVYAEQLLHIASEMPAARLSAAAIAMARPSTLEGRLLAILDATRNRRQLSRSLIALTALFAFVLAIPVACVKTSSAPPSSATGPGATTPATNNNPAAATSTYLPLVVVEESVTDRAPEIPILTVGALPKESIPQYPVTPFATTEGDQPRWNTFRFQSDGKAVIAQLLAGKIHFTSGPTADAPAFALLTAPLDQNWAPKELSLNGNTITLEVTDWQRDPNTMMQAGKNVGPRRWGYLISLGTLPAGNYKFALHVTHLKPKNNGYEYVGDDTRAATPFMVATNAAEAHAPGIIREADLQATHADLKTPGIPQIPPIHWAEFAQPAATPPPALQIGTYDAYQLLDGIDQATKVTVPTPKGAPDNRFPADNFAVVISYPEVNSGEWIALHSIEYTPDRRAFTITVDYWHNSNQDYSYNQVETPFIVIPDLTYDINPTPLIRERATGDFTVTLQWRSFLGSAGLSGNANLNSGGGYLLNPPTDRTNKALAPVTMKFSILNAAQSALTHLVPFDLGKSQFLPGDNITITEIRGTADAISPNNTYEIKGTYTLASHDHALLYAYVTSSDPADTHHAPEDPRQSVFIDRGSGTFTVTLPFLSKGDPHLSFYPAANGHSTGETSFSALYFQTAKPITLPTALKARLYTDKEAEQFAAILPQLKYPTTVNDSCKSLGIEFARICPSGLMLSESSASVATSMTQLSPHYWISFRQQITPKDAGITKIEIYNVKTDAPSATEPTSNPAATKPAALPEPHDPDAEAIQKLGGQIGRDGKAPDRPVISVDVRQHFVQPPLTDAQLDLLQNFKHLRFLELDDTKVTDAGLARLKNFSELQILDLGNTRITDAGLEQLKDLPDLWYLELVNVHVTDAGLEHLKDMKSLKMLALNSDPITDAGLAYLENLPHMEHLSLFNTAVTDAGLKHLEGLTNLQHLDLYGTKVTDAGLEHLKNLAQMQFLSLCGTPITGTGLANLKNMKALQTLLLRDTQVTDAGLAYLKGMANLKNLDLTGTKVTAQGMRDLRAALPGCNVRGAGAN